MCVGSPIIITCESSTNATWEYSDNVVPQGLEIALNTLKIKLANFFHQGFYVCKGTNKEGHNFYAQSTVFIKGKS